MNNYDPNLSLLKKQNNMPSYVVDIVVLVLTWNCIRSSLIEVRDFMLVLVLIITL